MALNMNEKAEREIGFILLDNKQYDRKTKKWISNILTKPQLKELEEFYDYYKNKGARVGKIKVRTLALILKQIRQLGMFIKKPYKQITREDLEAYMKSLEGNHNSTKLNLAIFLKKIGKRKLLYEFDENTGGEKLIDCMRTIKAEPKVQPNKLLIKDEVIKMIKVCTNLRDKALISLLYETGARASEITSLNIEDVEFNGEGARIWIRESKSKKRYESVVDCTPLLQQYIDSRDEEDLSEPLFLSHSRRSKYLYERLQAGNLGYILKQIGRKAKINKPIFPHLFRHVHGTELKKSGVDSVLGAKRLGITRRTYEEVYLHSSDEDVEEAMRKARGQKKTQQQIFEEEQEKQKMSPKKCEFCNSINDFSQKYCKVCKRALSLKTFLEDEDKKKKEQLTPELKHLLGRLYSIMEKHKEINPKDETIKYVEKELNAPKPKKEGRWTEVW